MKLSRILSLFLALGVLIFLSVVSLFLFITFRSSSYDEREIKAPRVYLYQEFKQSSNENFISNGFVEMNRDLSNDEFLSYSSNNGNQIVISKFATSRFECQGSCSCSTQNRRSLSTPFTRPLFLIFSAISSSMALKMAEKTFHTQCLLQFSSSCDEQNIDSTVTSCSEKEEEEEEEDNLVEYKCEGYCVANKRITSTDGKAAQEEYLEETGGCENLKKTGTVELERRINEKGKQKKRILKRTGKEIAYPARYKDMGKWAQFKFSIDLTSFCKEMSVKKYWYIQPSSGSRRKQKASMCVGGGTGSTLDERLDYRFQNIKCVMSKHSKKYYE